MCRSVTCILRIAFQKEFFSSHPNKEIQLFSADKKEIWREHDFRKINLEIELRLQHSFTYTNTMNTQEVRRIELNWN